MRLWSGTLLLAASGCAQLFGIDGTSGSDVDPLRVSLTMQRWSIGASVAKNPQDLSPQMASFLLDDGAGNYTKLVGEQTNVDTFSVEVPTGTPPVMFTLPDLAMPHQRLWATPARDRRGVFSVFEHPDPEPPLPSSSIMLTMSLPSMYASNESFRVEAIGAWMQRGLVSTELPAPDMGALTINTTLSYASFAPLTGSPAARITSQDVVVVERYVGNLLTGAYQVPPFDQSDGPDPIMVNLVPVPANKPLNATVTPTVYSQRYSAVRPAVAGLGQSWIVNAAPGWSIGASVGPRLHAGNVAMTDTSIATMFGNPFELYDWRSLFQFTTTSTRTYMFQSMLPMTLSAQMYTVAEPSGTLTLDMPAGLPINIRANQVPLSTDGIAVSLDLTKGVEVDAITDRPNGTLYSVTLNELALSADNMSIVRTILVDALTTGGPKLTLPPDLFQVGHYYYFDFRCMHGGYTNAAMGDLRTLTLPYSISRADSAVFQVVAQ